MLKTHNREETDQVVEVKNTQMLSRGIKEHVNQGTRRLM